MTGGATLLLGRELHRLDRRGGRRRLGRVGLLLLLGCILLGARDDGPQAPFHALMVAQVMLALLLQPVRTAGLVVQGRIDGTLPLLGLTPLSSAQVLAGVCGASLSLALEGLLLSLPLLSIAAAYGGLDPALVAKALVVLVGASLLGTAVGAWVGSDGHRDPSGAATRAVTVMGFLIGLPVLAGLILEASGIPWAARLAAAPSAALTLPLQEPAATVLLGFLGQAALAGATFALAARRLERTVLGGDGPPPAAAPRKRGRTRPVPERRVVAWRERRRRERRGWLRPGVLAVAAVVLFFGAGTAAGLTSGRLDMAYFCAISQNLLLWSLALVWALLAGARAYVDDREEGLLELLVTTRLTPGAIVWQKLLGTIERGGLMLLAGATVHGLCSAAAVVLIADGPLPQLQAAIAFGGPVLLWSSGVALALAVGQYCSVLAPTSERAQTWAATVAVCAVGAVVFLLCPIAATAAMMVKQVPAPIEALIYAPLSLVMGLLALAFLPAVRRQVLRAATGER